MKFLIFGNVWKYAARMALTSSRVIPSLPAIAPSEEPYKRPHYVANTSIPSVLCMFPCSPDYIITLVHRRSGTWRFGASWPLRACALVVTHRESKVTVVFSLMTRFTKQLPVIRGVIGSVMISMVNYPLVAGSFLQVLPASLTETSGFL